MIYPGIRFQERVCLSPCSAMAGLPAFNQGSRSTLSIMQESVGLGMRPYLACAVLEGEPFSLASDLESTDYISTITLQGQSLAAYNVFQQQCINSWSIAQDLVFSCPARFLPSPGVLSSSSEPKSDDEVSVDLFLKQPGTLYAVIASGQDIPPHLVHRQVWKWMISDKDGSQGFILNPETRVVKTVSS